MRAIGDMLRRFRHAKDGLAAVEFAFVLPVMLSFFMGLVELGQALGCRADVANMASVGADLIAQESSVTTADMSNVYNALGAMLYPYSTSGVKITIYSIVDNGTATGKVAWSCTNSGTAPTTPPAGSTGGQMIANSNLDSSGNPTYGGTGSVILAQISYSYSSPISKYFVKDATWSNSFYTKPRRVAQITGPPSCP